MRARIRAVLKFYFYYYPLNANINTICIISSEYKAEYKKLQAAKEHKKKKEQEESLKRLEADLKSDGALGKRLSNLNMTEESEVESINPQISNLNPEEEEDDESRKKSTEEDG